MRGQRTAWWLGGLTAWALVLAVGGQARASYIDTTSLWNFKESVGPFGNTTSTKATAANTYGQTFEVGPTDTTLTDFTFWVRDPKKAGPITVDAYIMQWDGTKAVGTPVWSSTPMTVSKSGAVTFSPTNLNLSPNTEYVAFLTVPTGSTTPNGIRVGYVGKNDYNKGEFVYLNNTGSDLSQLTSTAWNHAPHGQDLAFRAHLVDPPTAPVPSGLLLGAIGSGGLLAGAWRKRWRKRA